MSSLSTSLSLLDRLRQRHDASAWQQFVELYTPLLFCWANRAGLRGQDAADLVQEAMLQFVRTLSEFTYEPGKSFRGWLRTVLLNRHRDRLRRHQLPVSPVDPLDLVDPRGANGFW